MTRSSRGALRACSLALAAVACALALAACGAGGGRSGSPLSARTVVLDYLRAASTNSAPGLCSALSSAAQSEIAIGGTCQQALRGGLAGFNGPAEHFMMSTLKITLSGVTGDVWIQFTGPSRAGVFTFQLIRQGNSWAVASALTWR